MKLRKNIRPFYAKWWFFIGLVILGWLTPITKNWYIFFFGESTIACPVYNYGKSNLRFYNFVFTLNGEIFVKSNALSMRNALPKKSVRIYYEKNLPENYLIPNLNNMYTKQNLFFPLILQIGLGVFFLKARLE
mgnify:FL=1